MAASVEVTGVAAVVAALRALGSDTGDLDAFDQVASNAAQVISARAPTLTGQLAESVQGRGSRNAAVVRASVPYAGAINYGWPARNIAPSGFMQAADAGDQQSSALRQIEADINQQINRRGLN